jgi:hypothetical protein
MSFFKKNSNAKRMNELNFYLDVVTNEYNDVNIDFNSFDKFNYINIKTNKVSNYIKLDQEEFTYLLSSVNNSSILFNYYKEILLIKKALENIFNDTDKGYHRYINLNISCNNIYCVNFLNTWVNNWFDKNEIQRPYHDDLKIIFNNLKKCSKIVIN